MFGNFIHAFKTPILAGIGLWYVLALMQITKLFYAHDLNFKTWAVGHVPSLILIVISCCLINYLIRELKKGNTFVSRVWYVTKIYLTVSAVLIFILWPGTWNWDDLWTLNGVRDGLVTAWQHVLSSYWMHMLLCILPLPGGIILLQVVIAGFFAGYIIALVEQRYELDNSVTLLGTVCKLFVFFTPRVFMYSLSYSFSPYLSVFVIGGMKLVSLSNF